MKLSTSTNLICDRPHQNILDIRSVIQVISEGGFERLDLNFYDWSRPNYPFNDDHRWEQWRDDLIQAKEEFKVTFSQSHAYVFDFTQYSTSHECYQSEQIKVLRSIDICYQLGVHTLVFHPYASLGKPISDYDFQLNVNYFRDLSDYCAKYNINIAIENMIHDIHTLQPKFGCYPEELLNLVKAINRANVGICWDFEHGAIMNIEPIAAIHQIQSYLFATHISDFISYNDSEFMHVLPYLGRMKWKPIIQALNEIAYDFEFSLEVHRFTHNMPDTLLPQAIRFAYDLSNHLLKESLE